MSINSWNINNEWTLFLDRDGVINQRIFGGYVTNPQAFIFNEGVLEAIASFSRVFERIVVVTNQQGIGKGIMTERNLFEIHDYMVKEITEADGRIDKIYFASNLRGAENDERKPTPAMGLRAAKDFPEIDFNRSIMVGDTDSDILFGKNLGMKTVRILSEEKATEPADLDVDDLLTLSKLLENEISA